MKNLKNKNLILILLAILISGCQSSQGFKMTPLEKHELNIIEINRDRIIHECYFMNAEKENNWRHQYILHMLNNKNEVISLYNPTNQGKEECLAHLKKVEKILKNESRFKLCARNNLEKMTETDVIHELHDFGHLGRYESPYYGLTFDTICNSKECFSISDTWIYTCPGFKK